MKSYDGASRTETFTLHFTEAALTTVTGRTDDESGRPSERALLCEGARELEPAVGVVE